LEDKMKRAEAMWFMAENGVEPQPLRENVPEDNRTPADILDELDKIDGGGIYFDPESDTLGVGMDIARAVQQLAERQGDEAYARSHPIVMEPRYMARALKVLYKLNGEEKEDGKLERHAQFLSDEANVLQLTPSDLSNIVSLASKDRSISRSNTDAGLKLLYAMRVYAHQAGR
jgi:hypothetical protein